MPSIINSAFKLVSEQEGVPAVVGACSPASLWDWEHDTWGPRQLPYMAVERNGVALEALLIF